MVSEGASTTDGAATRNGGTWKTSRLAAALLAAVVVVLAGVIGASGASAEPAAGPSASYIVTFAPGVDGAQQTEDIAAANASDVSAINTEIDGIGTMAHQNAALVEETNAALALTDEQTRALTEHIGRFTFRQGHAGEEHGERRQAAAA